MVLAWRAGWLARGATMLSTGADLAEALEASSTQRWTNPEGRWFDVLNWGSGPASYFDSYGPSITVHGGAGVVSSGVGGCACAGCSILRSLVTSEKASEGSSVGQGGAGTFDSGMLVGLKLPGGVTPGPVFLGDAIGDTMGTAQNMSVNSSVTTMIDHLGDLDVFRVTLTAGQTYTIYMERTAVGTDIDSYLSLLNSSGSLMVENDDSGIFNNAQIWFTAPTSGTYYIVAQTYENESQGNYALTFNQLQTGNTSPTTFPPTVHDQYSYDQSAIQINSGFQQVDGTNWPGDQASWSARYGQAATITYSFRATAPTTMPGGTSGFSQFNNAQIAAAEAALAAWAAVANITFVRVNDGATNYSNNAQIVFGNYSAGASGAAAFAFLPFSSGTLEQTAELEGDVWVNISLPENSQLNLNQYGAHALLHEIGHALGLNHPGEYNASEGESIEYTSHAVYYNDSRMFTVMSYFDQGETGGNFNGYSSLPLLHDIAAMQRLYGANLATRTGDTIYGFNSNTGLPSYSMTLATQSRMFAIWDGGGLDTLDLSGYTTNSIIDLREEGFSSAGPGQGGPAIFNISIARGAIIENAVGGSGNDTIHGNGVANSLVGNGGADTLNGNGGIDILQGGQGDDTLSGGDGDDQLNGGAGADAISGGDGFDTVRYDGAAAGVTIYVDAAFANQGEAAGDTTTSIEGFVGSTFNDYMVGGTANNVLQGFGGTDILEGHGGDDLLDGGDGDDALQGGLGGDILDGGNGFDTARYDGAASGVTIYVDAAFANQGEAAGDFHLSIEGIVGSTFGDYLVGGTANNILQGFSGHDILEGHAGNDLLDGGDGNDQMNGGIGGDIFDGGLGFDTVRYDGASAGVIAFMSDAWANTGEAAGDAYISIESLYGSNFNDTLAGASNANELQGFDGVDFIYGYAGTDFIGGGGGDDFLDGGADADGLQGGGGADQFVFRANEAEGDNIVDFDGASGDNLLFIGYGTAAAGATFTQINATQWQITSADGLITDIITLANGATVDASDYAFG